MEGRAWFKMDDTGQEDEEDWQQNYTDFHCCKS